MESQESSKPYRYKEARRLLQSIISDFLILSGDQVCPSDTTWQDVAGTASCSLHTLALRLDAARRGFIAEKPAVFPSPEDLDDLVGYDPIGGGGGRGRSDFPYGQGGGDEF